MSTTLPAVARAVSGPQAAEVPPELETLRPTLGRRRLPRPLTRLTGIVLVVAVWQLLCSTDVITPDVLGSPWTVARDAGHLIANGELGDAVGVSLQRVAWGLLLGGLVGTLLALITGLSRVGEDVGRSFRLEHVGDDGPEHRRVDLQGSRLRYSAREGSREVNG